jgi:hypothetical protein
LAKRRRHHPNKFQQEEEQGLFSFGPVRKHVFKWGLIAGAIGGIFMIRPDFISQVIGVLVVVIVSNYHINKATQYISRWPATIASFLGVLIGMFGVIIIGTIILAYFGVESSAP